MPLVEVLENQDNLDVEVRLLKDVTVISGQTVVRGEVMQSTGAFSAATGVAGGSNTGNGTIAGEVANDTASNGTYTIEMLTATTFKVIAPNGLSLDAEGATGSAYDDQIGFTITVGGTPFVAGDTFTILVTAGLGKQTSFITGNVPSTVMYEDVDASGGDVVGKAYRSADIKASEVDFGTGTDAEVRGALDIQGIYLRD
jgi:hypothetical protein